MKPVMAGTGSIEALARPIEASAGSQPDGLLREVNRRQVTVLFADVSGFTTFAERLDPEELRAFQTHLFETLTEAIMRFDGFVAKFLGDAVLALFGAPVAHENDPERALDAALDMIARQTALNGAWAARIGQEVLLHIAVHTGPVVVGSFGKAAGAGYDVTGDTVNTASRLLGAAAPGTILISDATCAFTRHRFACEPAGEVSLRGKSEPMVVHRLLGALAKPQSARGLGSHGLAASMAGRAAELDRLIAAFDKMQSGRAQFVSLIGEAGTGKSRLMTEFLARLEADGRIASAAIRRATASSLGEATYGVFGTLFREGYRVEREDSLDSVREKLSAGLRSLGAVAETEQVIAPVLSYILGIDDKRPSELEPEQLKRQILLAARTLVERRLNQSPLLILVEDIHWADAASIDLLRDVVDHLEDRHLMVLVSHRPETPSPQVARAAQSVIRLSPLSYDETRTFVSALFGPVDGDEFPLIQHFVATRAGGNPLFVEELVRSLLSEGVLFRGGDGRWQCTGDCETANVPPTLHGLILSRIDGLPAELRLLLQEASVLGMEFEEAILREVASQTAGVGARLQHLIQSELVQRAEKSRESGRYCFTHALVHEVVYQNLLLSRRTELHELAGRALERATGPDPERLSDLEALGHHWSLSNDKQKGARYLLAAGDWARRVYANDDAIRHYQRALHTLACCKGLDGQLQTVRERLGDLLALIGRRSEALAHYEALQQGLAAGLDRAATARLYRKIGGLNWEAGDRERARLCFESGLACLGQDGNGIERAQLFQEFGRLAFRAGDHTAAIGWAKRALAEAALEEIPPSDGESLREAAATRAQAYNTLGVALARTGRLEEAVAEIEQSIALAETHDLLQAACRGYANLSVLYSSLDPERSIETCLRGLETAKKIGDLGFQSRLYANLAVAYCSLTDQCEAEGAEAARRAVDLDRRLGLLDHLAVPLIVLGQIHQCHGEPGLAFASYNEALDLAELAGEPQLLFPCYDGLATLYLDAGNRDLAERYLSKSREVCARAGLEPDALMVLPFLS